MSEGSTSRRRFLALVGTALLASGGAIGYVRTRGYDVPLARSAKLVALSSWQVVLIEHAARRITAPDKIGDKSIPSSDDVDVAGFVDGYVARMAPSVRRDLFRLFAFVEHVAPLKLRMASRFSKLAPADQDRVLSWLESSEMGVVRGGFEGLKSLIFMGYYRDPRTWKIIGYEGPLVARSEKDRRGGP